jgi:Fe-S-cluster containining protein
MDEPTHSLGHLNYKRDGVEEEIEFFYPLNIQWGCIRCGACCGDVGDRVRMVMLLDKDLDRIEAAGEVDFFEEWDEGNFSAIMKKVDGKCVFLTEEECRIYEHRALLCRMYPFWLEKQEDVFVFGVEKDCPGNGQGDYLEENFFRALLKMALESMDY